MALSHSPRIVTDGLVLALDAGNSQKSYKTDNNLIPADTWAVSNFSAPSGWGNFGTTTENELIAAADPFGNTAVIWEGSCDATGVSGSDGGYVSSFIEIDKTKTYRVSAWVNRVVLGTDGRSYHGIDCRNVGAAQTHMIYRQNGSDSLYPYFFYTSDPPPSDESELPENEWVLIVGHIWPEGSGTGSSKSDTGVYNTDGTKRTITTGQPPQDLVFKSTAHEIRLKNMLYYNATDSTVTARSVYPRIDLVDGTEPSIDDLINNRVNSLYVYDMSGQNNHGTLMNGVSHTSGVDGYFDFDGTNDDVIDTGTSFLKTNDNVTLEAFFNHDSNSGSYFFLYEGNSDGFGGAIEFHLYAASGYLASWFTTSSGDFALGGSGVSAAAITAGEWNHAAVTYSNLSTASGASSKLYLNGVEIDSGSGATVDIASMPTSNLLIGRPYSTSLGRRYNGQVAAVKVYNRALTATEIQQNFNALRGRFGI